MEAGEAVVGATFITYTTPTPYVHVSVLIEGVSGTPRIRDGEKFSELRYFPLDSLPEPMFEPSLIALRENNLAGRGPNRLPAWHRG